MLPNESLLVVLLFADYKTLVITKLAGARFLRLAIKFSGKLARLRRFRVILFGHCIRYEDVEIGGPRIIRYAAGNQLSHVAACREFAAVIGPHAIATLSFQGSMWDTPAFGVIFDAAPPVKHSEDVGFYIPSGTTVENNSDAFMQNFAGMKMFRLWFDYDVFSQFSWPFLRQESARELRLINVTGHSAWTDIDNRSVEDLVRYCTTLPHRLDGEPLELDFSENVFYAAFALRIIELIKNSGRDLIFRMRTLPNGGEYTLDERDYTVDVDGATKRYVCNNSGTIVEVEGCLISMQSTA